MLIHHICFASLNYIFIHLPDLPTCNRYLPSSHGPNDRRVLVRIHRERAQAAAEHKLGRNRIHVDSDIFPVRSDIYPYKHSTCYRRELATNIGTHYATLFRPLYGKMSDIFGRKPCLVFAYAVFGLGSLFCGLARNMTELIAARAFAGLGGGGMTT